MMKLVKSENNMDFGKLFELALSKLYSGGVEALITLFVLIIAYLILDLRKVRKQNTALMEAHRKEREGFFKLVEKMNDKFLERDESHIQTMQEVVKESTTTSQNIKTVLSNFVMFMADSNIIGSNNSKK